MNENNGDAVGLYSQYLGRLIGELSPAIGEGEFIPRQISRPGDESDLLPADQVLVSAPFFVLVGPPGCGKTALLHHWMLQAGRNCLTTDTPRRDRWLPIYLDLEHPPQRFELDGLIEAALRSHGLDTDVEQRLDLLNDATPLLLIDNLDRVTDIGLLRNAARLWRPTGRSRECSSGDPAEVSPLAPATHDSEWRAVLACRSESLSAFQGWLHGLPSASMSPIDDRTITQNLLLNYPEVTGAAGSRAAYVYWLWRDPALEDLVGQPLFLNALMNKARNGDLCRAAVIELGIQRALESALPGQTQGSREALAELAVAKRQGNRGPLAGEAGVTSKTDSSVSADGLLQSGLVRTNEEGLGLWFSHPLIQAQCEAWAWLSRIAAGEPLSEVLQQICLLSPWRSTQQKGDEGLSKDDRPGTSDSSLPGGRDVLIAVYQLSSDKVGLLSAMLGVDRGVELVVACLSQEPDATLVRMRLEDLGDSGLAPAGWYRLGADLARLGYSEAGQFALDKALEWAEADRGLPTVSGLELYNEEMARCWAGIVTGRWQGLVRHALGQADLALESVHEARDQVRALHAEMWHQLGEIHTGSDDFESAIPLLQKAVLLRPDDAQWHRDMAEAYNGIGNAERALAELNRARELGHDPDDLEGELALAHQHLGELDKAEASYRRACDLEPENSIHYRRAATLLTTLGESADAITAWRRALAWDPGYAAGHHALGRLHMEGSELERARFHFSEAVRLESGEAAYIFDLGECEAALGDGRHAVEHLRQSVRLEGDRVEWHEVLAGVLEGQGLISEAVEHYRAAVGLEPEEGRHHAALGRLLRGQGEVEEALSSLERALALRAGDGDVLYELGQVYEELGREEEAVSAYRRASEESASDAAPRRALARVYLGRGDMIRAQGELRLAVRLDPSDVWALSQLSGVYEETGHLQDALEALEVAIRSAGSVEEGAQCHLRAGRLALRLGEAGGACGHLEAAVEMVPGCAEAHYYLGRAYQQQGGMGRAGEEYRRAIELAPGEAVYHAALGEVGMELGLLEEAREETAQAIALQPQESVFHGQLGYIERKSGHLSAARERYQQAVALDPQNPDHHLALAQLYQVEGQRERSCKHLEVALATAPERADLQLAWGEFQSESGEMEGALVSFARAVELAPEDLGYVDRYGRGLMQAGQHEAAIRQLRRVLVREPGRGETHYSLGQALEEVGCLDEAAEAYKRAGDLLSGDEKAEALYRLGRLALKVEGTEEATEALRQAVELRPQWAQAHHHLSLALESSGDLQGALVQARQAGQLRPDDGVCLLHLGVLCNRLGLSDEAISALERVLTLPEPPTPEIHFELGRAYEGKGPEWRREAASEYRRAAALAPEEACYQRQLGILSGQMVLAETESTGDELAKAIEALSRATELDASDHEARLYLGRMRLEEGSWEQAMAQFKRAKELDGGNPDYGHYLALALHRGGEDREALSELESLPQDSAATVLLKGICQESLNNPLAALAAYRSATTLSPDSVEPWQRLGSLLVELLRWDEAGTALQKALLRAEETGDRVLQARLHRQLGRVSKELSDPETALMHLQQVGALDAGDSEAQFMLGSLLAERQDTVAAIGALKRAVELEPVFPEAHYLLARSYEQRGTESDRERALASYAEAARSAPEQIEYLKSWANMLCALGQDSEAAPILRRVLETTPQDADVLHHLGHAEESLSRLNEAFEAYTAAAALNPDDADFLESKAVLGRRLLEARTQDGELSAASAECEELIGLWQEIVRIRGDVPLLVYRERGLLEAMCGHDEQAARDLSQAVALAPDDALLRRQRARVLQRVDRYEDALKEALAARQLEPGQAANHHLMAQCYLSMGQRDEAMAALTRAIELAPNQALYHRDLAETLVETEQMESAASALEEALKLVPEEPTWHHRLGALRTSAGLHTEAAAAYRQAVELCPSNPQYQHDLADSLARIGNLSEAAEGLVKALDLAPEQADWLLELGQLHERLGHYELAQQRYHQAARGQADQPQHLVNVARAAYLAEQEEEAFQALRQAIEVTEDWPPAFEALGDFHTHYGRCGEAVEAYLQAATIAPESGDYSFKLGRALHQLGEYVQAIAYLERSAAVDPHRAETFTELGDIYQRLERYDEAMQAYQQAAVIAPQEVETVLRLARLSHELGYLDQAQAHFQSLLELDPDKAAAYAHLGTVCADQGDLEGAVTNYLQAIERDPQHASYYFDAGLVYKQLREYKKAGHYFRQTVKLDPNNRDAYKQFAAVSALSFLGQ